MKINLVLWNALLKCDPRIQWRNPVLMVVEVCAALCTLWAIWESATGTVPTSGGGPLPASFHWNVAVWMWLTLYAANIAEALAEDRGRAGSAAEGDADARITARRVRHYDLQHDAAARLAATEEVDSDALRHGDIVVISAGETVPADGKVVWGVASVDESAITGESAPVIRETARERAMLTGGTRVISDRLVARIIAAPGKSWKDRMVELAHGVRRQKSPNELALAALLASFTLSFLVIALTLNAAVSATAPAVTLPILALLVATLIPTELAALISVTGIASMYRLKQSKVLVTTAKAFETAGDVTTVLFDKTGTVTLGDRRASALVPVGNTTMPELVRAAMEASIDDASIEGRSIVELVRNSGSFPAGLDTSRVRVIPFSAQTRLSGVDFADGRQVRKGAESSALAWLRETGDDLPDDVMFALRAVTVPIATSGGTPLVVAEKRPDGSGRVLGVVHLKDALKPGVRDRIAQLRALNVRTIMVTGDNPLTAGVIAAEVGVDDYVGDATPEAKLELVKAEQAAGHFVAMSGDGTNDAPAIAQADVGLAMNSSTPAVHEAANIIVLDDDPTKIIDVIVIGRRTLATRGALTTFNVANDLVRYFTLFPMLFVGTFPGLDALNILRLSTPASAMLATLIYSIIVIAALIPMALAGVPYRRSNLSQALSRNLLYYGIGGIVFPAIVIKLLDMVIALFPGY
ncbi:MAG: potassium-transporting ATPase subunit KdpB [Desulfobulbus sp.]|nr:potassium-transporting ATPase subunit KdpB [Desulfobulbus sp.]